MGIAVNSLTSSKRKLFWFNVILIQI